MEVAEVAVETLMLALFRSDTPAYQPVHSSRPLCLEDGDPQASLQNLKQLGICHIQDLWVRKGLSRVLVQLSTGEQYLALGLSDPHKLAYVAAEAGMGPYAELLETYRFLPADYEGKLPTSRDGVSCA